MKAMSITIAFLCTMSVWASTNLVSQLSVLARFEHQEDIDDYLLEMTSSGKMSRDAISDALVFYGMRNVRCSTEEERLGLIRAVNALSDYGQTNAVPFLEKVIAEQADEICVEALPAYMKLTSGGRSVEFLSNELARGRKFSRSTMQIIEGRLSREAQVSTDAVHKNRIHQFLSKQKARAVVRDKDE